MELQLIQNKIYELRGQRVMLDFDLAQMYGTETRVLKQAVRRNIRRFPGDFMFQLTQDEVNMLINNTLSQIVIPSGYNFGGHFPFAFTEQGVAMLSSVLKSDIAIDINISIMRAFVAVRQYITASENTTKELEEIKKQLKCLSDDVESLNKDHETYEEQLDDIYLALTALAKKQKQPDKPHKPIGFTIEKTEDDK
jgi:uncharacterized protein YfkK (UPF0435 family)